MVQVNTLKYKILAIMAIAANALFFGWLGAMASNREMPVIVYTAEAQPSMVEAGRDLRIEYTLMRHRSCDVFSDRFIIDANKMRHEIPDLNLRAGLPLGRDQYSVPIPVPPDAAKGAAVYRTITQYVCNPVQRLFPIEAGLRDIPFIIK